MITTLHGQVPKKWQHLRKPRVADWVCALLKLDFGSQSSFVFFLTCARLCQSLRLSFIPLLCYFATLASHWSCLGVCVVFFFSFILPAPFPATRIWCLFVVFFYLLTRLILKTSLRFQTFSISPHRANSALELLPKPDMCKAKKITHPNKQAFGACLCSLSLYNWKTPSTSHETPTKSMATMFFPSPTAWSWIHLLILYLPLQFSRAQRCSTTGDTAERSFARKHDRDSTHLCCSTPAAATRLLVLFPRQRKVTFFSCFFCLSASSAIKKKVAHALRGWYPSLFTAAFWEINKKTVCLESLFRLHGTYFRFFLRAASLKGIYQSKQI